MSNDGRICFIVVPDKNIMQNFSDFMAAIHFKFYALQNIHKDESSTSAQISP